MPTLTYDGQTNYPVWFADGALTDAVIESGSIPRTKITAGTDLSCFTKKGGISEPNTRNMVDAAVQCDTFDRTTPGTSGGNLAIDFIIEDEDGDQDAWDLFKTRTDGVIGLETGDTAGTIRIYKVSSHDPTGGGNPANTQQIFTVNFGVSKQNLAAVVNEGS